MTIMDQLREAEANHERDEWSRRREENYLQWMRERQQQHDEWMREEDRKHFHRMLIMAGIVGVLTFTLTLISMLWLIPWLFN